MTDEEWITLREAAELLGYKSDGSVRQMCAAGTVEARRVPYNAVTKRWLVLRSQVEALAERRAFEAKMKAEGMKRCPKCGEWKDRETGFWRGGKSARCRSCIKEQRKSPHKKPNSWAWGGGTSGPMSGSVLDYIGIAREPARPQDSLKYACMKEGFAHRAIPIGQTKRQAFCAVCTAERCVHHPHLRPEDLCLQSRVKRPVAAMSAACGGHGPAEDVGPTPAPES